jgi:hypothetical protein
MKQLILASGEFALVDDEIYELAKDKGVSYDRTHEKYKAYYDKITIGKPKKRINIGTFNTESEAVEARQKFLEEQKRCAT